MERSNQDNPQFVRPAPRSLPTTFNGHKIQYQSGNRRHPSINQGKTLKLIHVLVWEQEHGKKPEGYDLHHKDFDKTNWDLENLELLSKSDHKRIHAGWIKTEGAWSHKPCKKCNKILPLSEFYKRKGPTNCACGTCKKCQVREGIERARKNPKLASEKQRLWHKNNPEKSRAIKDRQNARRKGKKRIRTDKRIIWERANYQQRKLSRTDMRD